MLTKVGRAKAMVFPVVVYGCESWTIKKAEHQKIDGFVLLSSAAFSWAPKSLQMVIAAMKLKDAYSLEKK